MDAIADMSEDGELNEQISSINMDDLRQVALNLAEFGASLDHPSRQVPCVKLASADTTAEIFQVTEKVTPNLQRVLLQDEFYYLVIIDGHLKAVVLAAELATFLSVLLDIEAGGQTGGPLAP